MAAHVLASIASQATQLAPPMPHVPSARRRHVAPSQHPAGHEAASHTQRPATQRWPAWHITSSPQAHVPSSAHVSARTGSHTRQLPPVEPQAIVECGRQVAPVQQPSGQLVASQPEQAPPLQVWPVGHASHAWPALPQKPGSLPVRHWLPSQQPDGQLVASHTHVPAASQRCPASQAGPPPHPKVQVEAAPGGLVHDQPSSMRHSLEQPSPLSVP